MNVLAEIASTPLRSKGFAVSPPLVLMARCLVIAMVVQGTVPFPRFIPLVPFLEQIGDAAQFDTALRMAYGMGCILIMFTPWVRMGALVVGAAFMTSLLACRPCHSGAHTYLSCLFLLIGVSNEKTGVRLIQLQVVILYAGATLHKALDADWWNGSYFQTLMIDRHDNAMFRAMAVHFPDGMLATVMGIATIGTEAALVLTLYVRRLNPEGVAIGVLFHSIMVLWLHTTFGPFYSAVVISYLAFLPWPEQVNVWCRSSIKPLVTACLWPDLDKKYLVSVTQGPGWLSLDGAGVRKGLLAVMTIIVSNPLVLFLASAGIARGRFAGKLILLIMVSSAVAWFLFRSHQLREKKNLMSAEMS